MQCSFLRFYVRTAVFLYIRAFFKTSVLLLSLWCELVSVEGKGLAHLGRLRSKNYWIRGETLTGGTFRDHQNCHEISWFHQLSFQELLDKGGNRTGGNFPLIPTTNCVTISLSIVIAPIVQDLMVKVMGKTVNVCGQYEWLHISSDGATYMLFW